MNSIVVLMAGVVAAGLMTCCETAAAQDAGAETRLIQHKGVSPEATKSLPTQADDGRGHLMPLHTASVLEWLCGDPNVLGQLKGDRRACYKEMWPGVKACEAQMQGSLPRGRSKAAATGKPDIVAFRGQLRQCLQSSYVERQVAGGKTAVEISGAVPDPLAKAMGGD